MDAQSQAVGTLFTPMEITISAPKGGACYLSGLAPETLGAWCGSLKVKKPSTGVFVSDNTGLISGGFSLATAGSKYPLRNVQVQSLLDEKLTNREKTLPTSCHGTT